MSDSLFIDQREYLRVYFTEQGCDANFHYFWLRHHCPCCIHPTTKERILCPSKVSLEIKPQTIATTDTHICLTWPDGHQSKFALGWLYEHRYSRDEDLARIKAGDLDRIEVQYEDCADELITACHHYLRERGAILVRGCPLKTEDLIARFTERDFTVRNTHFGYIEDLKTDNTTNKNTDQLGYTNSAVELHTDQPYIEDPPHFQLLQCIEKAETGGKSLIADARQAAYYLRDLDHHAFEVLTETPVLFDRQQQNYESKTTYPILSFESGEFAQIRSSYFTYAPLNFAFEKMEQWYRAYQKFTDIISHPAYQFKFLLHPNDFVLYDNFSVLHGRTSFTGPRWMKGIYFDPNH